jgi:hypothetical protein
MATRAEIIVRVVPYWHRPDSATTQSSARKKNGVPALARASRGPDTDRQLQRCKGAENGNQKRESDENQIVYALSVMHVCFPCRLGEENCLAAMKGGVLLSRPP